MSAQAAAALGGALGISIVVFLLARWPRLRWMIPVGLVAMGALGFVAKLKGLI